MHVVIHKCACIYINIQEIHIQRMFSISLPKIHKQIKEPTPQKNQHKTHKTPNKLINNPPPHKLIIKTNKQQQQNTKKPHKKTTQNHKTK